MYSCSDEPETLWRPIESAPVDGTHILAFGWTMDVHSGSEGRFFVREIWRKWNNTYRYVPEGDLYRREDARSDDHWATDKQFVPTHWMPLPEPPRRSGCGV